MNRFGIYIAIGLLAFLVGSATVTSAAGLFRFVLTDEDGPNAKVGPAGRLWVNAAVKVNVGNLPLSPDG